MVVYMYPFDIGNVGVNSTFYSIYCTNVGMQCFAFKLHVDVVQMSMIYSHHFMCMQGKSNHLF